jgi:hypothetical protein
VADPSVPIAGAITATVASVFGYLGVARGRRAADAALLMEQMRMWAEQVQESERKCREDMTEVRIELEAEHRARQKLGEELEAERSLRRELRDHFESVKGEMDSLRAKVQSME